MSYMTKLSSGKALTISMEMVIHGKTFAVYIPSRQGHRLWIKQFIGMHSWLSENRESFLTRKVCHMLYFLSVHKLVYCLTKLISILIMFM